MLALCACPTLLKDPKAADLFPKDAIARAKELMGYIGSIGAYSDSRGAAGIRDEVAASIEARDGCALPPTHLGLDVTGRPSSSTPTSRVCVFGDIAPY